MDLQSIADELCSEDDTSLIKRARLLNRLQIFCIAPGDTKLAKSVRTWTIVKRLGKVEKKIGFKKADGITRRLQESKYQKLLDSLMRIGGVKGLLFRFEMAETQKRIEKSLRKAEDIAAMVEFSLRYSQIPPVGKSIKGGPTMARYFVHKARKLSDGTTKNRWHEYQSTAVLIYLLLRRHPSLQPPNLKKKSFLKNLKQQASDRAELKLFFAEYAQLTKILTPRGYQCAPLVAVAAVKPDALSGLAPFSDEELEWIRKYSS